MARGKATSQRRPEIGLRLIKGRQPRIVIEPRDGFPWRGLAAGLACWIVIAALWIAL
jgi:hypothetical protein